MKKHLALVAAVAVLSSSAYATKARLGALGQGRDGSYYISDTRNVFYNASAIVDMNKYVVAELGENDNGGPQGGTSQANTTIDRATAPNAEGGYFGAIGRVAYGVYLGFQDAEANGACRNNVFSGVAGGAVIADVPVLGCVGRAAPIAAGVAASGGANYLGQDNRVDLFVGGDQVLKWGLSYYWAQGNDDGVHGTYNAITQTYRTSDTNGARLGLAWNGFKYWLNVSFLDRAIIGSTVNAASATRQAEQQYNQKHNWNTGLSWNHKNWTFYLTTEQKAAEVGAIDATTLLLVETFQRRQVHTLGVGYQKALSSKASLFSNLDVVVHNAGFNRKGEPSVTVAAGSSYSESARGWALPLNVGFETEVFSWLTARAAVKQNLGALTHYDRYATVGSTSATRNTTDRRLRPLGSTEVNAGATLEFGKLKVDGLVGTTDNSVLSPTTASKRGILALDQLLTRVGASYWF